MSKYKLRAKHNIAQKIQRLCKPELFTKKTVKPSNSSKIPSKDIRSKFTKSRQSRVRNSQKKIRKVYGSCFE